jgi:hypothetical protein
MKSYKKGKSIILLEFKKRSSKGEVVMPRYAYIPYDPSYEGILLNIEVEEFQDKNVIAVDSTTLTPSEHNLIKNDLKENYYCYVCDTRMGIRRPKKKHPHFYHKESRDCFEAESLVHAEVKKNLYDRFKKRGYRVIFERVFKTKNKTTRTDVAVLQKKDILAIEVQASASIKRATISERTNTYAKAGIPTAWVIVLDSFLGEGEFTSTKEQVLIKNDDGTSRYEEQLLPYEKSTPFVVTVEIPKSFYFLLDTYKYIVAVNHEGHFFVIRRTEPNECPLEIFRVEQNKVVDTLLATEIIEIDYETTEGQENDSRPTHEFEHKDGQHLEEELNFEFMKVLGKLKGIEWVKAYLEEQKQLQSEKAIDVLSVIKETKRRELLYGKKIKILNEIDQDIINLRDKYKEIHNIIKYMKDGLDKQLREMEKAAQRKEDEKIKKKQRELQLKIEKEFRMQEEEILKKKEREHLKRQEELKKIKYDDLKKILMLMVEKELENSLSNVQQLFTDNDLITTSLFDKVLIRIERKLEQKGKRMNLIDYVDRFDVTDVLRKLVKRTETNNQVEGKGKVELDFDYTPMINKETFNKDETDISKEVSIQKPEFKSEENRSLLEKLEFQHKRKHELIQEIKRFQLEENIQVVDDIERLIRKRLPEVEDIYSRLKLIKTEK